MGEGTTALQAARHKTKAQINKITRANFFMAKTPLFFYYSKKYITRKKICKGFLVKEDRIGTGKDRTHWLRWTREWPAKNGQIRSKWLKYAKKMFASAHKIAREVTSITYKYKQSFT